MTMNHKTNSILGDQEIQIIPISQIKILNPRSRNKKVFAQLVENITKVGLKRPITISKLGEPNIEGYCYELICGQGRLEALKLLGEKKVPCVIVNTHKEDNYLISLVENLARRKHSNKELSKV